MNWFSRKPKSTPIAVATPEPEEQWQLEIITDTQSYPVDPIPKSKLCGWAFCFAQNGASLEKNGQPSLFIPAHSIKEIRFKPLLEKSQTTAA